MFVCAVSTSSGTEWVQRTIELPVYKRYCYIWFVYLAFWTLQSRKSHLHVWVADLTRKSQHKKWILSCVYTTMPSSLLKLFDCEIYAIKIYFLAIFENIMAVVDKTTHRGDTCSSWEFHQWLVSTLHLPSSHSWLSRGLEFSEGCGLCLAVGMYAGVATLSRETYTGQFLNLHNSEWALPTYLVSESSQIAKGFSNFQNTHNNSFRLFIVILPNVITRDTHVNCNCSVFSRKHWAAKGYVSHWGFADIQVGNGLTQSCTHLPV